MTRDSAFLIEKLYRRIRGRRPDEAELSEYLHQFMIEGHSIEEVAGSILQAGVAHNNGEAQGPPLPVVSLSPIDVSQRRYDLADFLSFQGEEFVRNAFRQILKREARSNEVEHYINVLSGDLWTGRLRVIRHLLDSAEAANWKTVVSGLEPWNSTVTAQVLPHRQQCTAAELQGLEGDAFIRGVYTAVLHREPQPKEFASARLRLFTGTVAKAELLVEVIDTDEAKRIGVQVSGLESVRMRKRLFSLPFVGRVLQTLALILNLPNIERDLRGLHHNHLDYQGKLNLLQTEARGLATRLQQLHGRVEDIELGHELFEDIAERLDSRIDASAQLIEALQTSKAEVCDSITPEQLNVLQSANSDAQQRVSALGTELSLLRDAEKERVSRIQELTEKLRALTESKAEHSLVDEKADRSQVDSLQVSQESLAKQLRQQKERSISVERRLALILEEARKRLPEPFTNDQIERLIDLNSDSDAAMYTAFEDVYRGTREDIKARQQIYLERVRTVQEQLAAVPVVDVGCGRGEWLELLGENGLTAIGVDWNSVMVQRCRNLGLNAIQANAIDHLASLPRASVAAVTGFHIVEHLPLPRLLALLDESLRVLSPGGLLILETPNPENVLVGSNSFYLDPTHQKPLPPPLLQFLIEQRGFVRTSVEYLHPHPEYMQLSGSETAERLNQLFYGPRDYAVIAYKA
jgi:SAM-dependent methyltransferase